MQATQEGSQLVLRFERQLSTAARGAALLLAVVAGAAPPLHAQSIAWVRQFVYSGDVAYGVATAPGDAVYLTGLTYGNLDGQHGTGWDQGFGDVFLTRTDSTGYNYGSRQLDTSRTEISYAVAADKLGNVFIAGSTEGPLFDFFKGGLVDGFYAKFDGNTGATLRTQQIGTADWDEARAVAADGLGNGYVAGFTGGQLGTSTFGGHDVFVLKSAAADAGWTKQFGTAGDDEAYGTAADTLGNVYVAGFTTGNLSGANAGGRDAFVTNLDPNGNAVWARQVGTEGDDEAAAAATDGLGNVYITGCTTGDLVGASAGGRDAFLTKYDTHGNVRWTREYGTAADEQATGVAVDRFGNVFISGYTSGSLSGDSAGAHDAFVAKYSSAGALRWTRQFGTNADDFGYAVAADANDNIYVSGQTKGYMQPLSADFQGNGGNAFVVKILDPAIPGDFNDDGVVDAADYTVWRDSLGSMTNLAADGSGNGVVDQGDYDIWESHFGERATSGASAAILTPEPATVTILLVGIGLLSCRRRLPVR